MFYVLNKSKIYSYLVVFSTVTLMFLVAELVSNNYWIESKSVASQEIYENIINEFKTNDKEIAITINCNDTDENIEKIFDILNRNNITVTFCVSSEWTNKYPLLVKKMIEKNYDIVNIMDKNQDLKNLKEEAVDTKLNDEKIKIEKLIGRKINNIRIYNEQYNNEIIKYAEKYKLKIIGYGINSLDYQKLEPEVIYNSIKNQIKSGCIITLSSNSEYISEELQMIISELSKRNYKFITIEEAVEK